MATCDQLQKGLSGGSNCIDICGSRDSRRFSGFPNHSCFQLSLERFVQFSRTASRPVEKTIILFEQIFI